MSIFLMLPILSLITLSFAAHALKTAWNTQMSSLTPFFTIFHVHVVDRPDFLLTGCPVIHYWFNNCYEPVADSKNRPEFWHGRKKRLLITPNLKFA
jgi:hypothetical protein